MATAPTFPLVSVEEYLRSSYEPECEYIDGVLEPKSLPSVPHSILHTNLTEIFLSRAASNGFKALIELRVPVAPRRFRVPDISLMSNGFPDDRSLPPIAIIEILSPDDRVGELIEKTRDYHSLGIDHILAADPHQRVLFVADTNGALQVKMPAVVTLEFAEGPPLTIDFDALFSQIPQE